MHTHDSPPLPCNRHELLQIVGGEFRQLIHLQAAERVLQRPLRAAHSMQVADERNATFLPGMETRVFVAALTRLMASSQVSTDSAVEGKEFSAPYADGFNI